MFRFIESFENRIGMAQKFKACEFYIYVHSCRDGITGYRETKWLRSGRNLRAKCLCMFTVISEKVIGFWTPSRDLDFTSSARNCPWYTCYFPSFLCFLKGFDGVFPINFIRLLYFVGLMNKFMNSKVLKAFRHGDRPLLAKHPELETVLLWVYFHSNVRDFKHVECWRFFGWGMQGNNRKFEFIYGSELIFCILFSWFYTSKWLIFWVLFPWFSLFYTS